MIFPTRLPSGYREVEYIETADGTSAYIDTGFTTNINMKIEIDAQAIGSTELFIGAMPISGSENSNFTVGRVNNTMGYLCWNNAHIYGSYGDWSTRSKATVYQSGGSIHYIMNGIDTTIAVVSPALQSTANLYLFRRNDGGTPSAIATSKIRLFGCKLWSGDALSRNFVPCYRTSDNEIGLYDLVNGVFYTNVGTGTFTKGSDVRVTGWTINVNGQQKEVIKVEDGNGNVMWRKPRLPSEYQEVAWIGSDGNPYIDVSERFEYKSRVETEFATLTSGDGGYAFVVGITPRSLYGRWSMGTWNSKFWTTYGQRGEQYSYLQPETTYDTDFHKWIYDYGDRKFSMPELELEVSFDGIHMEYSGGTLKFFYGLDQGTAGKIKSFTQWHDEGYNTDIMHDFIPCYRKSDNVIGMYDLVTSTFYTNAGSGTFTKGNDV